MKIKQDLNFFPHILKKKLFSKKNNENVDFGEPIMNSLVGGQVPKLLEKKFVRRANIGG